MESASRIKNPLRIVTAVAIGLVIGRFSGIVFMLLIMTTALLVALVARIIAQERHRTVGLVAKIAFALGIGVLAGRLIGWFGIVGGLLALVLIAVGLVVAGADIM